MSSTETYRPDSGDRVGLWAFLATGVVIAAATLWGAIARIVEVLPNRDVEVLGEFAGTVARSPIGPDGASVDVALDQAVLTVPSLPAASLAAIVIQQVVLAAGVFAVVTCLVWLIRNVVAGETFSRRNTRLVSWAGGIGFAVYAAVPFLGNMAANGGFARLSAGTFDNVIMAANPFGLVVVAFLTALAGTVFAIGDRMRRDADGLV